MTDISQDESRRRHRHQLTGDKVTVVDRQSGDVLGTLVNVHIEGFMLLCERGVKEDCIYQVFLRANGDESSQIAMGVDCLWLNEMEAGAESHSLGWAGFQIIDISASATTELEQLIEQFAS